MSSNEVTEPLRCDDPSVAGTPLSEPHHDYGKWSRPKRLNKADPHLYKVRACSRCGQEQHQAATPHTPVTESDEPCGEADTRG